MDFTLTHEQELIRASARDFCEREVLPHVRDWDRSEDIDRGLVAKLADVGYLGAWELDTISYALVMEELGRADSSVRGIVSVNVGLVGKTILKWGTEAQQVEWLPRLAAGEVADVGELLHQRSVDVLLAVPVANVREDLALAELARR